MKQKQQPATLIAYTVDEALEFIRRHTTPTYRTRLFGPATARRWLTTHKKYKGHSEFDKPAPKNWVVLEGHIRQMAADWGIPLTTTVFPADATLTHQQALEYYRVRAAKVHGAPAIKNMTEFHDRYGLNLIQVHSAAVPGETEKIHWIRPAAIDAFLARYTPPGGEDISVEDIPVPPPRLPAAQPKAQPAPAVKNAQPTPANQKATPTAKVVPATVPAPTQPDTEGLTADIRHLATMISGCLAGGQSLEFDTRINTGWSASVNISGGSVHNRRLDASNLVRELRAKLVVTADAMKRENMQTLTVRSACYVIRVSAVSHVVFA